MQDFTDSLIEEDTDAELEEVMFSDLYKAISDPTVKVGDIVAWGSPNSAYDTCGKVIAINGEYITISQGKGHGQTIVRHKRNCNCQKKI